MSMTLPVDNLVTLIRAFAHQISHIVDSRGGYVLKYVGDAVISFFPGRLNNKKEKARSLIALPEGYCLPFASKS
jgi:class 3 adenylate cyclase